MTAADEAAPSALAAHWVANSSSRLSALSTSAGALPLTFTERSAANEAYVASLRSAWVRYPAFEASRALRPSLPEPLARIALSPLDALIVAAGLDRTVIVSNRLVSTNLHTPGLAEDVPHLADALHARFPDRPFALRNVCAAVDPALPSALRRAGWALLPARLVYCCHPRDPALWQRNRVRQDAKLLDHDAVEVIGADALMPTDIPRLRWLYAQVFLLKHSRLNTDYTEAFFADALRTGALDLRALRHEGRLIGVIGLVRQHGWVTTPMLGVDPQAANEAPYRRLMALLLRLARENGDQLHYSAGAGEFKRARGGEPVIEYTAVFGRHLAAPRRAALAALSVVLISLAPRLLARTA
jgi:Acetyltransferase (GNAT) domain